MFLSNETSKMYSFVLIIYMKNKLSIYAHFTR